MKRTFYPCFQEDWHKGVIGIVLSIETYYRPTLVLPKAINMQLQRGL
jgi:single-stranded DNA-specific DHH superfamily exonuclease